MERATENDLKVFMEIHGKMSTPEQSAAYQTVVAINGTGMVLSIN